MKDKQLNLLGSPSIETPLKYMGGKKNFYPCFLKYLPSGTKEIISPFFGGGGLELRLTNLNIRVHGSDFFEPLVNFWKHWIDDADLLIDDLLTFYPLSYEERRYYTYTGFKKGSLDFNGDKLDDLRRASLYWNVTSVGWGGTSLKIALSSKLRNLKTSRFTKFRSWQNKLVTIKHADYRDVLKESNGRLLYLDPPYVDQERFYQQIGFEELFDHNELAERLKGVPNWMMSYGDHDLIRDLYKDFNVVDVAWQNKGKTHNELLILNINGEK